MHVYYADDLTVLLSQCVAPLVRQLYEEKVITGFFFVRHWLEGRHLRLRMRVVDSGQAQVVRSRTEEALGEFLRRRPALRDPAEGFDSGLVKKLFLREYSERQWAEHYGDGGMPVRPNNSFAYMGYDFEADRYGGPGGVELVEWHFHHSSAAVVDLLQRANMHVRTVMLGSAVQFMAALCSALVPEPVEAASFMERYGAMWREDGATEPDGYADAYASMLPSLHGRIADIHAAVVSGDPDGLGGALGPWARHAVELRAAIGDAAERGDLVFDNEGAVTSQRATLLLLGSFLHMTNNRIGASGEDEAYLSYLLRRTFAESLAGTG